MNKDQLLHIVERPLEPINADAINQLEELVKVFPYFQGGHILLARAYHYSGNVFADKKIKKAAVYTANRKQLKYFISNPITEAAQETTEEINTTTVIDSQPEAVKSMERVPEETTVNNTIQETLQQLKESKQRLAQASESTTEIPESDTKKATEKPKKEKPAAKITKKTSTTEKKEKPKQQKDTLSSSRLGDAFQEVSGKSEQKTIDNTPDILLQYLEHMRSKKRINKASKKEQLSIIDSFIEKEPTISRIAPEKKKQAAELDLSQHSTIENTKLISENLALIYSRQGNISKAISIYEELILKYPLKKAYFASQIEKLKN